MVHLQGVPVRLYPRFTHPRLPRGNFLPQTLVFTLFALLVGVRTAQAQDGRAILTKTLQVYQAMQSYAGLANVDTKLIGEDGQTIKIVGASSVMKFQQPDKLYLFLQTPNGSRSIYSDGITFSVYDATPDQYFTIPMVGKQKSLPSLLLKEGEVAETIDPLFFLTQKSLPKDLTNVQCKGLSTCNGHPVYVVTAMLGAMASVQQGGHATPASYWTWWIDRRTSFLYKVEITTPNVVRAVAFGYGAKRKVRDVKGTLVMRHTVSALKPDVNLVPSVFAFTPPATSTRKMTTQQARNTRFK